MPVCFPIKMCIEVPVILSVNCGGNYSNEEMLYYSNYNCWLFILEIIVSTVRSVTRGTNEYYSAIQTLPK